MRFVTPSNEEVTLDYVGHIYALSHDGVKIAVFTGEHPLTEAVRQIADDEEIIFKTYETTNELPSSWDAWHILIPTNNEAVLQRAIAAAFCAFDLVDRMLFED